MTWPVTVKGWAQLAVAVLAVAGTLSGAAWKLHTTNAYADDVQRVERMVAEGLDNIIQKSASDLCSTWLSEITLLEARKASGDLTPGQRDRLIFLRGQYEAKCKGDS